MPFYSFIPCRRRSRVRRWVLCVYTETTESVRYISYVSAAPSASHTAVSETRYRKFQPAIPANIRERVTRPRGSACQSRPPKSDELLNLVDRMQGVHPSITPTISLNQIRPPFPFLATNNAALTTNLVIPARPLPLLYLSHGKFGIAHRPTSTTPSPPENPL